MSLHNWRSREWKPAIRAAGIEPERRIRDDRPHLRASRPDAEEHERGLLEAFDNTAEAAGRGRS
jgi:hypothetical protein